MTGASRIRRILKWAAVGLCLLLIGTCSASSIRGVVYHDGDGGGYRFVCGALSESDGFGSPHTTFQSADPVNPEWVPFDVDEVRKLHRIPPKGWEFFVVAKPNKGSNFVRPIAGELSRYRGRPGWHMEPCGLVERMFGRGHVGGRQCRAWRRYRLLGTISGPFFLLVLVTGCLWYPEISKLYRRLFRIYPPGHCQACGYNLFANISGICPECGEPCKPDASEAAP